MTEVWKPIVDDHFGSAYEVSNIGGVRRVSGVFAGRRLAGGVGDNGYLVVYLSYDGRRCKRYIHILVARAFIGLCPVGKEVNHKDRNRQNPRLDNLEYLTRSQNNRHSIANGALWSKPSPGELNGSAKLREEDVVDIRRLANKGHPSKELAALFLVDASTVRNIVSRRNWKHVA
jgi:hypothetical protein